MNKTHTVAFADCQKWLWNNHIADYNTFKDNPQAAPGFSLRWAALMAAWSDHDLYTKLVAMDDNAFRQGADTIGNRDTRRLIAKMVRAARPLTA